VCLTFPLLHSLSLGEGWGEDILFVFSLSACVARTCPCGSHYLPVVLRLPVWFVHLLICQLSRIFAP
ncbi:MAG: hypothetical protein ACFNJN_08400, partial [Capnocytophaga ochracea]